MTNRHGLIIAEMEMWERKIELCVKPKPWWIPSAVHAWLLSKLLVQIERTR